ncbi:IS110 family transposase [Rhodococcus zopfii]|uniref:IS110 family transposase n=1 Tax=Rhodococcus zopfii TaxID=43772 RepID=UPI0011113E10|nr:IS110 family transposase [Rhodococcus zopfii]
MTTAVIVGIDPHRKVFTATALDERGRRVADEHFANTSVGHHAALRWARELGSVSKVILNRVPAGRGVAVVE